MAPPTYRVSGSVRQANDLPVSGVRVHLSTGAKTTTDAKGEFRFDDLLKGTYDVNIDVPDGLRAEPEAGTVRLPGDGGIVFYLLPMPVEEALDPEAPTLITYLDTQGLPTHVTFPAAGAEGATVTVTPELPDEIFGFLATGHTFDITPGGNLAGADSAPNTTNAFQIELQYSQADLRSVLSAEGLTLLWLSPDGWVDATTTCETQAAVAHDYQTRTIQTTLCAWGTYSLVGPARFLHFPLLMDAPDAP